MYINNKINYVFPPTITMLFLFIPVRTKPVFRVKSGVTIHIVKTNELCQLVERLAF